MLIVVLATCLAIMFIAGAVRRASRLIDRAVLSDVMDGTQRTGQLHEPRLTARLMV
jgi:hypothetical protein